MKQKRDPTQISFTEEGILDSFAGGGGASTGIEIATGRVVTWAINHDPDAILMHSVNHPFTEHYTASVWDVDPVEVCKGRPVGLAWFSPDCFVAGTLILTNCGYRPIEEIRVGDLVLTHKGRWRPVVETITSEKPIYKVRGYGNPGLVCSGKHPFYTATKNENAAPAFKEAKDLEPGKDYWGIPTEMISPIWDAPEDRINRDLAWLAGRYVGDGWLRMDGGHYETVITCGEQDIESLRAELAERTPNFKWNFRRVRTGGQFTHCGKGLCVWLNGNFGRLSDKKTIPAWLYAAPARVKADFIDGYMSADGWKREDGLREASTVSKRLAYGLVQLLATLGRPATVYYAEQKNNVIEGRKVNVKPVWKVKWRKAIAEKHEQHFTRDGVIWRPIRDVTDLQRTETVYNIGVADDESYVAEGVIVHNCKHFSKAKGSPLVDRNIRGLSWVVVKWALYAPPRVILMENVEEIQTWGPLMPSIDPATGRPLKKIKLIKGGTETTQIVPSEIDEIISQAQLALVPDPDRKGETFQGFVDILTTGISPDHPALLECCEFLKISPDSADAKRLIDGLGYKLEFKELIAADYGAPTSRKRFVLVARCDGRPIVWPERTHAPLDSEEVKSGKCKPWRAAAEIIDWSLPMYSIFDSKAEIKRKYGVNAVRPLADNTLRRIICGTDKYTIRNENPFFLIQGKFQNAPQSAEKPLTTITAVGAHEAVYPVMAPFTFANTGFSVGLPANEPMGVVRTSGGIALGAANLVSYHADENGKARVNDLNGLLPTVDSSNRFGLTTAQLVEYYGNGVPVNINDPMRTVTSHDREGLLACHLDKYFGGGYSGCGNDLNDPLTTVTQEPRHSMVAAHIAEFKGNDKGQSAWEPLRTITASAGEFGAVKTVIERYDGKRDLGYWPEIRRLLNKHCGYHLADDEVLLLIVGGVPFYIRDILLRMLAPRELYNAMGFPPDYIIDFTDPKTGKEYPKSAKVARCGNAVCPPMAEAVVRANLPEWCGGKIETMGQFKRIVSA